MNLGAFKKGMYPESNTLPKTTYPVLAAGMLILASCAFPNNYPEKGESSTPFASLELLEEIANIDGSVHWKE